MKNSNRIIIRILVLSVVFGIISCNSKKTDPLKEYGDLLDSIQMNEIFKDQKKFVDCVPKHAPSTIKDKYYKQRDSDTFDLRAFVARNFDTSFTDTADIIEHIEFLWNYLSRPPFYRTEYASTLIPLRYPYIVPGGRFREIYYWDSYFTMLGLEESKRYEMIKNMLNNFKYLIDTYGFIPNGNRTYYLSRSQPPFFSVMVELFANLKNTDKKIVYKYYLSALKKEYAFWMRNHERLSVNIPKQERVVLIDRKDVLNRYWDDLMIPRPESFKHDVGTKNKSGRDESIYREIRAAAESGWDFSSRWLYDGQSLSTIHTTDICPVDLNSLLYHLEVVLSKACGNDSANLFKKAAEKRKKLMLKYFWNEETDFFFDYNHKTGNQTGVFCVAGLYPLFFKMVDTATAKKVASVVEKKLLQDGGLVTSLYNTGQQWDYPNGWAPLQWIGYKSFKNYGLDSLADKIADRWLNLNMKVFFNTRKMLEKYDVVDITKKGGGGEYKLQDGFGWTNGVFLKLWNERHRN